MFSRNTVFLVGICAATVSCGISRPFGVPGGGVTGRVTPGDLFLLAITVFSFFNCIFIKRRVKSIPGEYLWSFPLFFVFLFSGLLSTSVEAAFLELIIHLFGLVFSLALLQMTPRRIGSNDISSLLQSILVGSFLVASYGVVVFFIFPGLNPVQGGLAGSFRNTGQAGHYFLVFSSLSLAGLISGLIRKTPMNIGMLLIVLLALILTGKRASLVGLLFGCIGVLLNTVVRGRKREDFKILSQFIVVGTITVICLFFAVIYTLNSVDGAAWRFQSKFTINGLENFTEGFYYNNLYAGFNALADRPFIGVGLGNIIGTYHELEIHSTYVALLATSGLVGFVFGMAFLLKLLMSVFSRTWQNDAEKYMFYFFPFMVGLVISWGYTYSFRKREFWMLVFVVTTINLARKSSYFYDHTVNGKH